MKNKYGIALAVLALVLSTLACSIFQAGPGKTAQKFITAIENGKVEEALGYLSSTTLQSLGEEKWRSLIVQMSQQISSQDGIKSTKVTEEVVNGDIATVTLQINYGDGTNEISSMEMIKEDGEWKVNINPYSK